MKCLLAFLLLMLSLRAEVIDKLVITVGHNVITELGIDEDLRVVALINGQQVNRGLEMRRAAADRLVQRLLIQHEMEVSRYPLPTKEEVGIYRQQVQTALGGAARLADLLKAYDLTPAVLDDYLKAQLTMLRFIEYRFSPDVTVSDADVDSAYAREQKAGPMSETQRGALVQRMTEERTDAALDTWLAESRKQVTIEYLDKTLQ